MRTLVFAGGILGIIGLMEWVIFKSFRRWIRQVHPDTSTRWQWMLFLSVMSGNGLIFLRFVFRHIGGYQHPIVHFINYGAGLFIMGVLFAFLSIIIARFLTLLLRSGFKRIRKKPGGEHKGAVEPFDPGRRKFLKLSGYALAGVSVGTPVIGALSTSPEYHVFKVPLFFENLPPAFDGLTIAQVSDIHAGPFISEKNIREIFEIVNSLTPDLIVLTGDFVDSSDVEIPAIYRTVGVLKADLGVYGCLGNHDHYATSEKVNAALRERNVTMLNNANRIFQIGRDKLVLAGIDDAGSGFAHHSDFHKAAAGLSQDDFKILLSHRPAIFPLARRFGFDLTLSGHTHGGQIGINLLGVEINPIAMLQKYDKGLFEEGGKKLYVNVGVGMAGVPIRLVPREISLFTLHTNPSPDIRLPS